jgi:hypothetical protein
MRCIVECGFRALVCAALAAGLAAAARADEAPGITVTAKGVAEAMPDVVELVATVEGNAELAGDALEKFRGNKRRLLESLDKLKLPELAVAGSGLSINSGTPVSMMAVLQAGQSNEAKVADKVAFQEHVTITLSGISGMSAEDLLQALTRIVDVVKDAGAPIGGAPKGMLEMQLGGAKPAALATFKLGDPAALRGKAYQAALDEARATAGRLAEAARVELGEIVGIRESAVPAAADDSGGMATYLASLRAWRPSPAILRPKSFAVSRSR